MFCLISSSFLACFWEDVKRPLDLGVSSVLTAFAYIDTLVMFCNVEFGVLLFLINLPCLDRVVQGQGQRGGPVWPQCPASSCILVSPPLIPWPSFEDLPHDQHYICVLWLSLNWHREACRLVHISPWNWSPQTTLGVSVSTNIKLLKTGTWNVYYVHWKLKQNN